MKANTLLREESRGCGNDKLLHYTRQIESEGERLYGLISDTIEIARKWESEWGQLDLCFEDFAISDVVQDVAEIVHFLAAQKNNLLTVHCADNIGSMCSDVRRVRQILLFLLSNASKSTERGNITLHVYREMRESIETLVFKISDTGIGISPEHQQRLFIRPLRHSSSSGDLGLVITSQFCQMMGGDIIVESEEGKGTIFTVCLPAQGKKVY
jgi:signal transduction histidine kinase